MKNINDEDIENLLVGALKKEPEVSLPFGFAAMVTKKVYAKPIGFGSYVMALFVGCLVIVMVGLAFFLYYPELTNPIFSFLISVKYIIISVVAIFLIIEYFDQRFIKKAYH